MQARRLTLHGTRRTVMIVLVLLTTLLVSALPAQAAVIVIDPAQPPPTQLSPAESERLKTLQSATFPFLFSDISPDNQAILTSTDIDGTVFRDLRSGAITKPDPSFFDYFPAGSY
ncbi:MAG: hypothetical protein MI924_12970, partial [Chloroflexales bacterium]|nr:hypothetical protein [Chloroflexales bacterium]